jgi:bifunctional UDP-N-acetylglucosamine pyrophosphorylase/glucosamine-1-phosphate N-acetyltransferase
MSGHSALCPSFFEEGIVTLAVVLLAAGHGTRMQSKKQKILHHVAGAPMVSHVFEASEAVADLKPVLVVGPEEHGVSALFGDRARYVTQAQRLGTGHATMMADPALRGQATQVLVTYGDMPLLQADTMQRLARAQAETSAALAMLTVMGQPDSSFGRVVRDSTGAVQAIVEVTQARRRPNAADLLAIPELNVGVYCFEADWLWSHLRALPLRQARSGPEYYLTDMVALAVKQDKRVTALVADDADEALGAGTREELAVVEAAFRRRTNRRWLAAGVTLVDPETTYIEPGVIIGQDSVIWPNTHLQGATVIGADCAIGPNALLRDARLGDGCRVEAAVVEASDLPDGTYVGPFTSLRGDK